MIKQCMEELVTMVHNGILEKKEYFPLLSKTDNAIQEYLDGINYSYCDSNMLYPFEKSADERLALIISKYENIKIHPEFGLQEVVERYSNYLRNFLSKYYIGFLHDVYLNENGTIYVEIHCMIHSGFGDNRESEKRTFEQQMSFLKSIGIVFGKSKYNDVELLANQINIDIITELLKNRGAKLIKMETRNEFLSSISFRVRPNDIEKFNEKFSSIVIPISETLNADEIYKINKNAKDLLFSKSGIETLGEDMKITCGHLIEGNFNDICEIFAFNGNIRKRYSTYFSSERSKNEKIRNLENEISLLVTPEHVKTFVNDIYLRLENEIVKSLGFRIDEFHISEYGCINVTFRFISDIYSCFGYKSKIISDEEYANTFDVYKPIDDKHSRFLMLDTDKNKHLIRDIIFRKIPSARFYGFNTVYRSNNDIINEMTFFIDNILDLFNLEKVEDEFY